MIRIICVGKLKEKYLEEAVLEYKKRLSKYTKVEVIEVLDSGIDDEVVAKRKEASLIEKYLSSKDYLITLEIEGKTFTSEEFSKKLETIEIQNSNIVFLIGGSYGIDDSIKSRSDLQISFSKMTFPHQLFRVMLLEQLYRAYKIRNNESYHK